MTSSIKLNWRNCDEDDIPGLLNLIENSTASYSCYQEDGQRWDNSYLEKDLDQGSQWQCLEIEDNNEDLLFAAIRYQINQGENQQDPKNHLYLPTILLRNNLSPEQEEVALTAILRRVDTIALHLPSIFFVEIEVNQYQGAIHENLLLQGYQDRSGHAITLPDQTVVMVSKYIKEKSSGMGGGVGEGNALVEGLGEVTIVSEGESNNNNSSNTPLIGLVEDLFTALHKEFPATTATTGEEEQRNEEEVNANSDNNEMNEGN